jgi:hypothetical protein
MKLRIFWDILPITVLMMEAARNTETSADIQLRTRQYIPEDSELQYYFGFFLCFQISELLQIFELSITCI